MSEIISAEDKVKNAMALFGGTSPAELDDKDRQLMQDALSGLPSRYPFVRLVSSNSNWAKGKIVPAGNYAIATSADDPKDLGPEISFLVLAIRFQAVDTTNKVRSYFRESALYKEIAARSHEQNSGCLHGPEFLIVLGNGPEGQPVLATLHLGSISLRNAAPNVIARLKNGFVRATSKLTKTEKVENGKVRSYTYEVPIFDGMAFDAWSFDLPDVLADREQLELICQEFRDGREEKEIAKAAAPAVEVDGSRD